MGMGSAADDARIAWETLAHSIAEVHGPRGDYNLKLATVTAGVQLLFEFPAENILTQAERSNLPTRAIVSWLVFEGSRLPAVEATAVEALRELYESLCPPGQGIIPPPRARRPGGIC